MTAAYKGPAGNANMTGAYKAQLVINLQSGLQSIYRLLDIDLLMTV